MIAALLAADESPIGPTLAIIVGAGMVAQWLAWRTQVPSIEGEHADIELRPRATPHGWMTLALVRDRGAVQPGEAEQLAKEAQRRLHLVRLAAEDLAELVAALMLVLEGASCTEPSSPDLITRVEEAHSTAFLGRDLAQQLLRYGSEQLSL